MLACFLLLPPCGAVWLHRALGEPSSPSCPDPRAAGSWEQGPGLPGSTPGHSSALMPASSPMASEEPSREVSAASPPSSQNCQWGASVQGAPVLAPPALPAYQRGCSSSSIEGRKPCKGAVGRVSIPSEQESIPRAPEVETRGSRGHFSGSEGSQSLFLGWWRSDSI